MVIQLHYIEGQHIALLGVMQSLFVKCSKLLFK